MEPLRLRIEGRLFKDAKGREVTIHGINCAGDAKYPKNPDLPSHIRERFFEGDSVSFVGRPFSVEDAHIHFARLKRYGYNTIRYIWTWEALEHERPGKYDEEWIQHTIEVLRLAKNYGFYVYIDPHQDVWSRFSGGSGAPMWTLYAMGLNPKAFSATEAALVQNALDDPSTFPKMIWSTNYTRFACQVAFTLFFAGRDFAPKCIIDGQNIQDYLQSKFVAACKHLATRIREAGDLEHEVVIGWESMNEPNRGLVGMQDVTKIPSEQKLQKGTSPTAWQAMLTGSGRACEIDTWDFGGMGPFKTGSALVDPKGVSAWLPSDYDDTKYGWKRDPGWKLGHCIWALHNVWDPSTDQLLKPDYFGKTPSGTKIDYEYFTNNYFMDYYRRHSQAIKSVMPDAIMFCQPPVLEIPPSLKGTADEDPNMVYAPHYYDGVTLMTKKWNRYWNVDVFGILRGRYLTPAFAIKIGETAIRNCMRDQLAAIRQEGLDYMGDHPCVFTEIGIPFDMDNKAAYVDGNYTSQALAMDANHFALEGCGVNGFSLWVYATENCHQWGDMWNGEDLSIFSVDDKPLLVHPSARVDDPNMTSSRHSVDSASPAYSRSRSTESLDSVSPLNLKNVTSTGSMSTSSHERTHESALRSNVGFRAAEAYVRPTPLMTAGELVSFGFDLRNAVFTMTVRCNTAPDSTAPTEIFLPEFHFPRERINVEASSGKWEIAMDSDVEGQIQKMKWWHEAGESKLKITGVQRRQNMSLGKEEEEGYIDQCQQAGWKCSVM